MIKLLTSLAGADYSYGVGEKVELDKDFEKRLVESGQAERVRKTPAKAGKKKAS